MERLAESRSTRRYRWPPKRETSGSIREGLTFKRYFTRDGVHPYDEVVWEPRDARSPTGRTAASPSSSSTSSSRSRWSLNATNIVAQKYFRGTLGTPQRESSLRQVIDRVVDTITGWGREGGYFVDDDEARGLRATS